VFTQAPPQGVVPAPQLGWHMPVIVLQIEPIAQVVVPGSQRSRDSLQLSVPLHAIASPHERDAPPTHEPPAVQVSMIVQNKLSSHDAPVFGDQAVVERPGRQTKQRFAGFVVSGA